MSYIGPLGHPMPKMHTCLIAILFQGAHGWTESTQDSVPYGLSRCYTSKNSSSKLWQLAWVGNRVGRMRCGAFAPMANIAAKVPERLLAFSRVHIAEVGVPLSMAGALAAKSLQPECVRCSPITLRLIVLIFFATAEVVFSSRSPMSPMYIANPVGFLLP